MIGQMEFEVQLERDKIDAKRNINQEYISWVAGLGGIMKNIAGEKVFNQGSRCAFGETEETIIDINLNAKSES